MKMIVAIIRPEKVDDVLDALDSLGILGVTITDVHGRGEQGGIRLQYRAGQMQIRTLPKTKLEIVLPDSQVQEVLQSIRSKARTGEKGDGRIFVIPVDIAAWVRTDEYIS